MCSEVVFLIFCQVSSEDRSALWALITFHGGNCQLNLNKKCTHLIVPEPKGVSTSNAPSFYITYTRIKVFLKKFFAMTRFCLEKLLILVSVIKDVRFL